MKFLILVKNSIRNQLFFFLSRKNLTLILIIKEKIKKKKNLKSIYINLHTIPTIGSNNSQAILLAVVAPLCAKLSSFSSTTKAGTTIGVCSKFLICSTKLPRLLRAKRWLANFSSRSFSSSCKTSSGNQNQKLLQNSDPQTSYTVCIETIILTAVYTI